MPRRESPPLPEGITIIDDGNHTPNNFMPDSRPMPQFHPHNEMQHPLFVAPSATPQNHRPIIVNNATRVQDIKPDTIPEIKDEKFYRKKLTTYDVYCLTKDDSRAKASTRGKPKTDAQDTKPSWERVVINKMAYTQADTAKKVKNLNEESKKVTDKVNKLYPHQQTQISLLLEHTARQDPDLANFEWSVGQLDQKITTDRKGRRQTASITVYLQRSPREEVNATMLYHNLQRERDQVNQPQHFQPGFGPIVEERPPFERSPRIDMHGGPKLRPMSRPGGLRRRAPDMQEMNSNIVIVEEHLPDHVAARPERRRRPVVIENHQQSRPPSRPAGRRSPQSPRSRPPRPISPSSDSSSAANSDDDSGHSDSEETNLSSIGSSRGRPRKHVAWPQPHRHHSRDSHIIVESGRGQRREYSHPRMPDPHTPRHASYNRPSSNPRAGPVTAEEILAALARARTTGQLLQPTSSRTASLFDGIIHEENIPYRQRDARRDSVVGERDSIRSSMIGENLIQRRREDLILRAADRIREDDLNRLRIDDPRMRAAEERLVYDPLARDTLLPDHRGHNSPYPFRRESLSSLPLGQERMFEYSRNPFAPRPGLYRI